MKVEKHMVPFECLKFLCLLYFRLSLWITQVPLKIIFSKCYNISYLTEEIKCLWNNHLFTDDCRVKLSEKSFSKIRPSHAEIDNMRFISLVLFKTESTHWETLDSDYNFGRKQCLCCDENYYLHNMVAVMFDLQMSTERHLSQNLLVFL